MGRGRPGTAYPSLPRHYLDRPILLAALDRGASHRVLLVSAGPGFGKTTQLSAWARRRRAGWYTATGRDADLGTFASGIAGAIPHRATDVLPARLSRLGPQAGDTATVEAIAGALADALRPAGGEEVNLVLDDIDQVPPDSPGATLLGSLCRQAPDQLHLVLAGRGAPPPWTAGLRGRGLLADVDAGLLTFTADETAALLTAALGPDADVLVEPAYTLTEGWPAAVQILVEALDLVAPDQRLARLAALRHPGERLDEYLAEEVIATLPTPLRELLRIGSVVPSFAAPALQAAGVGADEQTLHHLTRHGLLTAAGSVDQPVFHVRALLASAVRRRLPAPEPRAARAVRTAAARWFTEHQLPAEALNAVRSLDDPAALVAFLQHHGDALLAGGETAAITDAIDTLPTASVTPRLWSLAGEARQVRGDWPGALTRYRRAAAGADQLPAGLAWRMGLIHYCRGELDQALDVLERGRTQALPDPPHEQAKLLSWTAAVHWMRNDYDKCRQTATEALDMAAACGDDTALAVAHTTRAMLAATEGDRAANLMHYEHARAAAERAGDVLALIRVRNNLGSRALEDGRYHAAAAEFDEVIRLTEITGYAYMFAIAMHNRGLANTALGRLDQAATDFTAALHTYQRLDSKTAAYPLMRLGDLHRLRGDLHQARAVYEQAVIDAATAGDAQGMVPALAGLARVLAVDDPLAAAALLDRALACGPGISQVEAQLAAGWIALQQGDHDAALDRAARALPDARARSQLPRIAEAIELGVLAGPRPHDQLDQLDQLDEADRLWRQTGHLAGHLTNRYLHAQLNGRPGTDVEHQLHVLGVRLTGSRHAAGILSWLSRCRLSTVEVHTLGGFHVVRDGKPITVEQWRSKKARDILKILIARRGRRVARDVIAEALWPDESPGPVANRLSVALSTLRGILDPDRRYDIDHYVHADKDALTLGQLDVDVLAFLRTAHDGLRLRADDDRDHARIVLAAAHSRYTGDFLEDDPYPDWAIPLREEARAAYLQVTRALAELASSTDDAVGFLLRLLEHDPYDEQAHLHLVDVLAAAGRHGEARRRYRTYLDRVAELGIDPAPYNEHSTPRRPRT